MIEYITACHGKARYATRTEAKAEAKKIRGKGGPRFKTYECPFYPGHWHLASLPGHATHLRRSPNGPVPVGEIKPPVTTPESFRSLFQTDEK